MNRHGEPAVPTCVTSLESALTERRRNTALRLCGQAITNLC